VEHEKKICIDCGKQIGEHEGFYGRAIYKAEQPPAFIGLVCDQCIFSKMSQESKRELLKAIS
jgi:hypothetical protein